MLKFFLLVFASVLALPGHAGLSECIEVEDDAARLSCFDAGVGEIIEPAEPEVDNDPADLLRKKPFSLLNARWELEKDLVQFAFRPYKPVYFMPMFYSTRLNTQPQTDNPRTSVSAPIELDHLEAKLQLSFKTKLINDIFGNNGDLWMGYTQASHWQLYNGANSRPFRETNHEPELMMVWRTDYEVGAFTGRMISVSLTHQSNGREEPLSRSWNRVILTLGFDRPDWVLQFRPWIRLPEASDDEDENPLIVDYVGRGELLVVHRQGNSHQLAAQFRHSLRAGENFRGSMTLNYSYPCFNRLRCHAQFFRGYGESLIDYNHLTSSFGVGVALIEWY